MKCQGADSIQRTAYSFSERPKVCQLIVTLNGHQLAEPTLVRTPFDKGFSRRETDCRDKLKTVDWMLVAFRNLLSSKFGDPWARRVVERLFPL